MKWCVDMKRNLFIFFLSVCGIGVCLGILFLLFYFPIKIENISYEISEKNIIAHIKVSKKKGSCSYENKDYPIRNHECVITVKNQKDEVFIHTTWNSLSITIEPKMNEIIDFEISESFLYLAVGETKKIEVSLEKLGNPDQNITMKSKDENIVIIEDNILKGTGSGETTVTVTAGNVKKEIKVIVTDLITVPTLKTKKDFLKCGIYSEENSILLDKILEYRIEKSGYQTRAGVVAALRFLTLEFPYQLNYFFESGRLNNNTGGNYVDGEGRFYHKGLYLHQNKYKELVKTKYGPAIWGCPLTNWQEEAGFLPGVRYPNGLDCSGFITWAMFNGGFDPKDTGAGDNPWTNDDLSDLGPHIPITMELLKSNTLKAGDIIATDGHIAMIGGIKDEVVYVAESTTYWRGVVMHPYTYSELVATDKLTYVIRMDDYYKEDGNYSLYWEE